MKTPGFTLAELLITLGILGMIATFTIPKVLAAQNSAKTKAILKETVASLNQILYDGMISGELTQGTYQDYLRNTLNHIKHCDDAAAEGCWPGSTDTSWNTANAEGYILHNGVMLTDVEYPNAEGDSVVIDVNGTQGPNLAGKDQLVVVLCWKGDSFYGAKAGQVTADSDSAASVQLFQEIFN